MNWPWLWKSGPQLAEGRAMARREGWSRCLEAVAKYLGAHSWVAEDGEIFRDGCGASLTRRLKEMQK